MVSYRDVWVKMCQSGAGSTDDADAIVDTATSIVLKMAEIDELAGIRTFDMNFLEALRGNRVDVDE